jgi:hypothetical protein
VELELDTFSTTSIDGDIHALEAVPLGKEPQVHFEQEGKKGLPSWSERSSERKVG